MEEWESGFVANTININSMKCLCILWFTFTHYVLKGFYISPAHGSFNCKNSQNTSESASESWKGVMFWYSPLHIPCFIVLIV